MKETPLTVPGMAQMMQDLTLQAEDVFRNNIMFGHDITIPIPSMVYDDLTNYSEEYSWAVDLRNESWTSQYRDHLFMRKIVLMNPEVKSTLCDSANTVTPGIVNWMESLKKFKVLVGVLLKIAW